MSAGPQAPRVRPAAEPLGWAIFTGEERVLALLLLFVAATMLSTLVPIPPWIRFFLSVAAIVPLAGFIGASTEALADELEQAIGEYLEHNNKQPKPFVWTASVAKILEKIGHCKAILETLH